MFISHRRSLESLILYQILSSQTIKDILHIPHDSPIWSADYQNPLQPTSPISQREQPPPDYHVDSTIVSSTPDLGERLPETIPLPQSSITRTRESENLPHERRRIDAELTRCLETLKNDTGWKLSRGRQDSDITLPLPALPPTPNIFILIPKRFLIHTVLSKIFFKKQVI